MFYSREYMEVFQEIMHLPKRCFCENTWTSLSKGWAYRQSSYIYQIVIPFKTSWMSQVQCGGALEVPDAWETQAGGL